MTCLNSYIWTSYSSWWSSLIVDTFISFLWLWNWKPSDHLWRSYLLYRRRFSCLFELLSIVFSHPIKVSGAWQFFMQNCHQSVKHLRADRFINVIILLEIHLLRARALTKNLVSKHLYLFLVTHSIFVIDCFSLFILVNSLFLLLSLLNSH